MNDVHGKFFTLTGGDVRPAAHAKNAPPKDCSSSTIAALRARTFGIGAIALRANRTRAHHAGVHQQPVQPEQRAASTATRGRMNPALSACR